MCDIGMRAMVPWKAGGVEDTLSILSDWRLVRQPCGVETAMGRLSRAYGESLQSQRRLFAGRRGTAVRFGNQVSDLFFQVRLADVAPALGYVHMGSVREVFVDRDGKCTIRFDEDHSLHTFWNLATLEKHISSLAGFVDGPLSFLISHPGEEEMARLAEHRRTWLGGEVSKG